MMIWLECAFPSSTVNRRQHISEKISATWLCDDLTINQHRAVQERLAASYGPDGQPLT